MRGISYNYNEDRKTKIGPKGRRIVYNLLPIRVVLFQK